MLMLWFLGFLIGQEDASPAVPPRRAVAVRVQENSLSVLVYRFLRGISEDAHRTPREQQVVDPLDGRGSAWKTSRSSPTLACWRSWRSGPHSISQPRVNESDFSDTATAAFFEKVSRERGNTMEAGRDSLRPLLPPDRLPDSGINPGRE